MMDEQIVSEILELNKFLVDWFVDSLKYLRNPIQNSIDLTLCKGIPNLLKNSSNSEIQSIIEKIKSIGSENFKDSF